MNKQYAVVSPVAGIKEDLPSILIADVFTPALSRNVVFADGVVKKGLGRLLAFAQQLEAVNHTDKIDDKHGIDGYPSNTNPGLVLDGDVETYWDSGAGDYWWISVDMGEDVVVNAVRICPAKYSRYLPKDFVVQGSADEVSWDDLYEGSMDSIADWQEFSFENETAYQYYRVYFTSAQYPGDTKIYVADIEFWAMSDSEINLLANFEQSDGSKFLIVGTPEKIFYRGITSWEDVTGAAEFSGDVDDLWNFVAYGDYFIFSNGIDPIIKWSGSGDIAELGGTPPDTAKFLVSFKNYLLAVNISYDSTVYQNRIAWCGIGEMENWAEGDSGDSTDYGEAIVSDSMPINGIGNTTDFVVLYKQFSMHLLRFVGGDIPFSIEDRIKGIGTSSPHSIRVFNGVNFFLGTDKHFYAFDGLNAQKISGPINDLLLQVKTENLPLVVSTVVPEQNKVVWAVPYGDVTQNNLLLIYDVGNNSWSQADMDCNVLGAGGYEVQEDESWEIIQGTWEEQIRKWVDIEVAEGSRRYLAGGNDGYVYEIFASVKDKGEDYEGVFVTKKIEFNSPNIYKRILKMQHYFSNGVPGDKVDVSVRLDNDRDFTDEREFDAYVENEDEFIVVDHVCDYRAKTLQLKIAQSNNWEYIGTMFYYSEEGIR